MISDDTAFLKTLSLAHWNAPWANSRLSYSLLVDPDDIAYDICRTACV